MNSEQRLTKQQQDSLSGGAVGLAGNMALMGMMAFPSIILSLVQVGLAIAGAVDKSDGESTTKALSGSELGALSPRPYIRLSPVVSRSAVTYGLPF